MSKRRIPSKAGDSYQADAAGLLSQQLWCFGRDVKHSAGNLLVEFGFRRTPPPPDRSNCSSVYTLEIDGGRRIVLRGFGIFVGDDSFGGLFIERFDFRPLFTVQAKLSSPPWLCDDLPPLRCTLPDEQPQARVLLLGLIDWIIGYEVETASRLGGDYRRRVLQSWENGKRWSVPYTEMIGLWRKLSLAIGDCLWNPLLGSNVSKQPT